MNASKVKASSRNGSAIPGNPAEAGTTNGGLLDDYVCSTAFRRSPSRVPYRDIYRRLFRAAGPQGWWPGRTRLEVMVGAVLTQNTSWTQVEKAIARLRSRGWLTLAALHAAPLDDLADAIRPAGYFNLKARRLRALTTYLVERHQGNFSKMFRLDTAHLRAELLAVHGIGPETADSILLYAGNHPVFVVDAYTRRFMMRHGWATGRESYDEVARGFVRAFDGQDGKTQVGLFNEFHALIVWLAKAHCRAKPSCGGCPLEPLLPHPRGEKEMSHA